jgi:hypothetical protein
MPSGDERRSARDDVIWERGPPSKSHNQVIESGLPRSNSATIRQVGSAGSSPLISNHLLVGTLAQRSGLAEGGRAGNVVHEVLTAHVGFDGGSPRVGDWTVSVPEEQADASI